MEASWEIAVPYGYWEVELQEYLHSQRGNIKRGQRLSVHMSWLFSLSLEKHLALELPSFNLKGFGVI